MIAPAPSLEPPPRDAVVARTRRILVADGDYDACDALVDMLRSRGHQVDFAYDAQTVVELVRQRPYELVILDHWPPYLDAFGLDRRLRLAAPGTKMVILDPAGDREDTDTRRSPGAARVLSRLSGFDAVLMLLEELQSEPAEIAAA